MYLPMYFFQKGLLLRCMETIHLNFLDIFKKIITDYDLTYSDIANVFLCSESTVPSYISGRTKISIDKAELLKAFLLESFDDDIYDKYIFNFSKHINHSPSK